jgi:regulator of telomere elongation helicase 1
MYDSYYLGLIVNFWCLNPGITFNLLASLNPISILLTSGTLSPLESYEAELKIPFDIKISCRHVIDPSKQVLARVVRKTLTNKPFNFTYTTRGNDSLLEGLGHCIINLLATVPSGVLVFFTSYKMLESCINLWSSTEFEPSVTILDKIASRKTICIEVGQSLS